MFNFIKNQFKKIYQQVTSKLGELFSRKQLDDQTLRELELLLINADTGVKTTRHIIDALQKQYASGAITAGDQLKAALEKQLLSLLITPEKQESAAAQDLGGTKGAIYLMVGINGSGKTTFASKLANHFIQQKKRVLFVAGDTFRAAGTQQLAVWAERIGADIVIGKENQDPASVIFAGCQKFKDEQYDVLIVDTAGRLQTKTNLMHELEKIRRTVNKQLPDKKLICLLTIDAMLGQNSFEQAKLFNETTHLHGVILTKMDGTGKGGIVFAINQELKIPILYVSFGESLEQFKPFNAQEYVHDLLNQ